MLQCFIKFTYLSIPSDLHHYNSLHHDIFLVGYICWKYFTCEARSHIDKIVNCQLEYILGELILLPPYGLGNNEPHKVYVQVNALDSWVFGPKPTSVPCPHEWATEILCDELSRPNNFKFLMVYIVDLVTFTRPFSNIIKNNTKSFRDIESSDISYKYHYRL